MQMVILLSENIYHFGCSSTAGTGHVAKCMGNSPQIHVLGVGLWAGSGAASLL